LRDNHRKALNLRKTKSGQATSNTKPPKYEKELSFLSPYLLDDAIRQSNFPSAGVDDGNGEDDDRNTDDIEEDSVTANDSNLSTQSSARSSYTSRSKRTKKCTSSEEPSAAVILKEYLDAKKATDIPNRQDDTLTNFFLNMADTVKSFPTKDQVELKSRIFQLVNSVEMRIANDMAAPTQSSPINSNSLNDEYRLQPAFDGTTVPTNYYTGYYTEQARPNQ
jgi:hypothetical protein